MFLNRENCDNTIAFIFEFDAGRRPCEGRFEANDRAWCWEYVAFWYGVNRRFLSGLSDCIAANPVQLIGQKYFSRC